ncbi:MAG TPA: transaldolase [Anaerolineaceae bacterium]
MNQNPLIKLESFGQSVWMDFIRRGVLVSGQMQRWIDEDGLSGVTSNPTIFEKAIIESQDYDADIERLKAKGASPAGIYDALTIDDIQRTTDLFRPVYDRAHGGDGFASLEVSPHLANDAEGSIREARRLWQAVNRPNVMIKIPGTQAGLHAIQELISEGINVNITLLFGLPRYEQVIEAYYAGLERRIAQGLAVDTIASVASFFLSRIDVLVDPQLEKIIIGSDAGKARDAQALHGQIAIASAKAAYQIFEQSIQGQRFQKLASHGARRQRLLWASTSTKNPKYSDVMYIEPLIGDQTINTMPVETLDAYRDHGDPAPRLTEGVDDARAQINQLSGLGIDINQVTHQLEVEGVDKFNHSYDQLLEQLAEKVKAI